MADALFVRSGDDRYEPTGLARGPWSPHALHGGPVAALVAMLAESVPAPLPMHPARLTLELLKPVPLAPLTARCEVLRPGKKVQLVEVELGADGTPVARARVLRLRRMPTPIPDGAVGGSLAPPPTPRSARPSPASWAGRDASFHADACEHRVVEGAWGEVGPCLDWVRLRVPLLPDTPATPFARVAAAADFGNGIGAALPFERFRFLNADLTIHLHRLPEGDAVALEAETFLGEEGVAVAESRLSDSRGRIGRALQSLLIEPR